MLAAGPVWNPEMLLDPFFLETTPTNVQPPSVRHPEVDREQSLYAEHPGISGAAECFRGAVSRAEQVLDRGKASSGRRCAYDDLDPP